MVAHRNLLITVFVLLLGAFLVFSQAAKPTWSQSDDQDVEDSEELSGIEARSGALEVFEPNPHFATIYVVRKKSLKGSTINKKIYFNYHYMGKIGNAKYAVYLVPPGKYILGVLEGKDKRSITLEVEAGKVYFTQLKFHLTFVKAKWDFLHIAEKEAKSLIATLNKVQAKDVEEYPVE